MSAYKKIECEIVDKDTLLEALELLGFDPELHDDPQNLTDYMGDKRNELANIIIPRLQVNKFTGASNDIGFLWNEENQKYDFICSEYDKKLQMDVRIIQVYVKLVLEKSLKKQGYKIKVNVDDELLLNKKLSDIQIVARKVI